MLETASVALLREEYVRLSLRFGTDAGFINAWGYHNATHGLDVAQAGVAGARHQVDRRALPPEAVPLARIAGIYHDDLQTERAETEMSPRREELSVEAAWRAMDSYEQAIGGQLFTSTDRELVREMILATQVTGFHHGRIEQNPAIDSMAGTVMKDADLSALGRPGIRRPLLLYVENEGRAGRLAVPYLCDGRNIDPDRASTVAFLHNQAEFSRNQHYILPVSEQLWPHRHDNAQLATELAHEYTAGSLSWAQLYDRSGPPAPDAGRTGDHLLHVDTIRHLSGLATPGAPSDLAANLTARPQVQGLPPSVDRTPQR